MREGHGGWETAVAEPAEVEVQILQDVEVEGCEGALVQGRVRVVEQGDDVGTGHVDTDDVGEIGEVEGDIVRIVCLVDDNHLGMEQSVNEAGAP